MVLLDFTALLFAPSIGNMASTCIRCQPSVGGDPRNLGKCDPDIKKQLDLTLGAITRVWGKGRNPGDRNDDPGDLQQSNFLLKNLSTVQEHNGRPVTKWMLENAYRKVYPYKSGENQAEKERNQRSTQAAPQTARTTKSTSKSHQMFAKGYTTGKSSQIYSKSAGGGGETGQVLPKKKRFPPGRFSNPPEEHLCSKLWTSPVHQTCELDTSLDSPASQPGRTGTTGKPLKVATIYIAVSKTPLKLCMYSIEYGTHYSCEDGEADPRMIRSLLPKPNRQATSSPPLFLRQSKGFRLATMTPMLKI